MSVGEKSDRVSFKIEREREAEMVQGRRVVTRYRIGEQYIAAVAVAAAEEERRYNSYVSWIIVRPDAIRERAADPLP